MQHSKVKKKQNLSNQQQKKNTIHASNYHTYFQQAWKAIGDRLQRPCYLSRVNHDRKVWSREQRTDIGKYSFANRTRQLLNQLPAEDLRNLSCKPSNFRKRVMKVINQVTCRLVEIIKKFSEVK
jgi:hypothetical protein